MFESATLKLTGWFLLVIMTVSILFSVLIYYTSTTEFYGRFDVLWQKAPLSEPTADSESWREYRHDQAEEAAHTILMNLININGFVLIAGGIASYLMANKTLQPLKRAHDKQARFVSNASHEFRTPLAVMKTEIEVALRDHTLSSGDLRTLLTSNLEEVNKLSRLSQTLLSLSKMEHQKLARGKANLNDAIDAVIERYDKQRKRITIERPDRVVYVYSDPLALEALSSIFIDNALKYSPKDSTVTIRISERRGSVTLRITNTGEGIDQKDIHHIFDSFYRADGARTSSDTHSFGFGLSLAKRIVALHEGELSVESEEGVRTTFIVTLPGYHGQDAT